MMVWGGEVNDGKKADCQVGAVLDVGWRLSLCFFLKENKYFIVKLDCVFIVFLNCNNLF